MEACTWVFGEDDMTEGKVDELKAYLQICLGLSKCQAQVVNKLQTISAFFFFFSVHLRRGSC